MATDEPTPSPFRPGFNLAPAVLAGRDEVLIDVEETLAIATAERRMPAPLILVGARGVGKTVLLGEIASRAAHSHAWPALQIDVAASSPFTPQLVRQALGLLEQLQGAGRSKRLRAQDVTARAGVPGLGGEVRFARELDAGVHDSLLVEHTLEALATAAAAADTGIVLTVDELQAVKRSEIQDLGAALQRAAGEGWPLVAALAGLQTLRGAGVLPSYMERSSWHELSVLDGQATTRALGEPAESAGRPFDNRALGRLADATGGYPYAIQLYGHHAWRHSTGQARIDLKAVTEATRTAGAQLARGMFAQRWGQASPLQRAYLIAAAEDLAESRVTSGRQVARRLERPAKQLSAIRARLIDQGLLITEGEQLRFALPGLPEYVLSMRDALPARAGRGGRARGRSESQR